MHLLVHDRSWSVLGRLERQLPGKHLVGKDTKGIEIRAVADSLPLHLFWTHIRRSAHNGAGLS